MLRTETRHRQHVSHTRGQGAHAHIFDRRTHAHILDMSWDYCEMCGEAAWHFDLEAMFNSGFYCCEDCRQIQFRPSGLSIEDGHWWCQCGSCIDDSAYSYVADDWYVYCGWCDDDDDDEATIVAAPHSTIIKAGNNHGPSQRQNRQRNVEDLQYLRAQYPNYCTHHLFYHWVLGHQDRACNLAGPGEAGCNQGGSFRSHELPPDLESHDLWAYQA